MQTVKRRQSGAGSQAQSDTHRDNGRQEQTVTKTVGNGKIQTM